MQLATLPLAGLTIVELESIRPVPFAGHLLRRPGAHVTPVGAPEARLCDDTHFAVDGGAPRAGLRFAEMVS